MLNDAIEVLTEILEGRGWTSEEPLPKATAKILRDLLDELLDAPEVNQVLDLTEHNDELAQQVNELEREVKELEREVEALTCDLQESRQ